MPQHVVDYLGLPRVYSSYRKLLWGIFIRISWLAASSASYTFSTRQRKSGRPAGIEMPAPVMNNTSPRACASSSRSGSLAVSVPSEIHRSSDAAASSTLAMSYLPRSPFGVITALLVQRQRQNWFSTIGNGRLLALRSSGLKVPDTVPSECFCTLGKGPHSRATGRLAPAAHDHKKSRARGGPAKAADSTLEEVAPRGERPKTASTGRE